MPEFTLDTKYKNQKFKQIIKLLIICIALCTISPGFNLFLSSSALHKKNVEMSLNSYESMVMQLHGTIERELNFGRPISTFEGLRDHLLRAKNISKNIYNIYIYDADNKLITTINNDTIAPKLLEEAKEVAHTNWLEFTQSNNYYRIVSLHLDNDKDNTKGFLIFSLNKDVIFKLSKDYINDSIIILAFLNIFTCVGMIGWLFYLMSTKKDQEIRTRFKKNIFIFVVSTQIIFSAITMAIFKENLTTINNFSAQTSGHFIASDLEVLQHKGLKLQNFNGLEQYIQDILSINPSISAIEVRNEDKEEIIKLGSNQNINGLDIPIYTYWQSNILPYKEIGNVIVYPNLQGINKEFYSVLLDQITTTVVVCILVWQLANLFYVLVFPDGKNKFDDSQISLEKLTKESPNNYQTNYQANYQWEIQKYYLFACAFLFFFGYDLTISFIPLIAEQLPSAFIPVSEYAKAAMPISIEATASTLAILCSGILNRKYGWKKLLSLSLIFTIVGTCLGIASYDLLHFSIARAFSGFGMGMFLMTAQICIIENTFSLSENGNSNERSRPNEKSRLVELSALYATLFAGGMCGSASGGMLYDFFDFRIIFFIAAFLLLLSIILVLSLKYNIQNLVNKTQVKLSLKSFLSSYFLKLNFLYPTLLVGLPAGMVLTGFLYLVVPTALKELSVTQAEIGRLFMLYGLCFVVIGPKLAEFTSKYTSQKYFVALIGITGGSALFITQALPTYFGFALAVSLVGISQCLLSSSMLGYILSLRIMQNADSSLVSSMYRICERLGQIVGPFVFGAILTYGTNAFYVCAAVLISMSLAFVTLSRGD